MDDEQDPTSELPTSKEKALIASTQYKILRGFQDILPNMYNPALGYQELREAEPDFPGIPTAEEDVKDLLKQLNKLSQAVSEALKLTSQGEPLKERSVGEEVEVNLKDYYPKEEQENQ